jgi:hypothetical protein
LTLNGSPLSLWLFQATASVSTNARQDPLACRLRLSAKFIQPKFRQMMSLAAILTFLVSISRHTNADPIQLRLLCEGSGGILCSRTDKIGMVSAGILHPKTLAPATPLHSSSCALPLTLPSTLSVKPSSHINPLLTPYPSSRYGPLLNNTKHPKYCAATLDAKRPR